MYIYTFNKLSSDVYTWKMLKRHTEMDYDNSVLCSSGMNLADSDANLEPPTSQLRTHTEEAGRQFHIFPFYV